MERKKARLGGEWWRARDQLREASHLLLNLDLFPFLPTFAMVPNFFFFKAIELIYQGTS
jgi:hypothetical protein